MSLRASLAAACLGTVVLGSSLAQAQSAPDPDPWWGTDKALHFAVAAGITGGSYAIATQVTRDIPGRAALAAVMGIGAGLGKEVIDSLGFGSASWKDLLWDVIGTGVALSVSISIDFGVRSAKGR